MSNSVLRWKWKPCQVRLHVVASDLTHNLREVSGDNVVDRSKVSRWSARFREGRLSTEDNPRSERPSTATDYTSEGIVNDILREDRRKICEEISY